jgi:hypothetical protein
VSHFSNYYSVADNVYFFAVAVAAAACFSQTFGGRLATGQIDDEFTLLGSIKNSGRTVIVATSKAGQFCS